MKHRLDTQEGVNELRMLRVGEHIDWTRQSPALTRRITVYLDLLTPEQKERLNEIEKELLAMAYEANEETRTKTVLKRAADIEPIIQPIRPDIIKPLKPLTSEANDQTSDEGEQ